MSLSCFVIADVLSGIQAKPANRSGCKHRSAQFCLADYWKTLKLLLNKPRIVTADIVGRKVEETAYLVFLRESNLCMVSRSPAKALHNVMFRTVTVIFKA